MKFKLVNIGPICEADIELGDFTLFLGLPSTGKSLTLKSIYTSLIFLDREYERSLRNTLDTLLGDAEAGTDYVISYILSLIKEGYNVCEPDALENIIEVVKKKHNFDISGTIEDNCLIKISERIDLKEKLKNLVPSIKEEIKGEHLKLLRKNVNYTDSSSIYINEKDVEDIIENLELTRIEIEDFRGGASGFITSKEGGIEYKMSKDHEDGILKINVEVEPDIKGKTDKKLRFEELRTFKPDIIYSIALKDKLLSQKIAKEVVEEYTTQVGISSVIFIPYCRSDLELLDQETTSICSSTIKIEGKKMVEIFSPLKNIDLPIKNFLLHIDNAKEKIRKNKIADSHILNLISAVTKTRIKVDEKGRIKLEIQNGVELEPFYASAMINEVTSILFPLLNLQKPALVLIEEPESRLHLAYQILLLLVMLSLVQHGYKFVITTHSDLMASFLGDLVEHKPSKEKIMELLKNIFGQGIVSPTLEKIIEDVEKTTKGSKIEVYYFENGTAREVPANRLANEVLGVTRQVVDKVANLEWELKENK